MTQAMRFDITARDGASVTFDKVTRSAEALRRELVRLDAVKAEPKLRLDGTAKALQEVEQLRTRLAGLGSSTVTPKVRLDGHDQAMRQVDQLRARLAGLTDTRVRVRVDVDANELTPLQQRLNALSDRSVAVRLSSPSAAEINRLSRLRDALNDLRDHQDRRIRLTVSGLDPSTPSLLRRTARYLAELKAVGDVRIRIDLDGAAEALAALLQIRAQLRGLRDRRINVEVRGTNAALAIVLRLGTALGALALPGTLAAGVTTIGGLTVSIGGLIGALGLVPAVALGAGAALGTLLLGLGGIGNAISKLAAAEEQAATGAGTAAAAREAAAERIRSAVDALADAEEAADRQSIDGARDVADARQSLADARVSAAEQIAAAEEALAEAEQQSAERVADARQAYADSQTQSAERVADARRSLADVEERSAERIQRAIRDVADAQERARESIESAQRAVTEAREQAADAAERAADQIADAERGVARAQEDRLDAQRQLTRAIEDATEAQEDLDLALRGGALSEERAVLRLAEAQEKLSAARASGVSGRELRELDLDAREAALTLDEARERYVDLQQEAAKSATAGVNGAEGVVTARQRVADAIARESEAEASLAQAREDARHTELEGTQRIADARAELARAERDAERSVTDARAERVRAERDATRDIADARQSLARAEQQATRDIADARRALDRAETDGARQRADAEKNLARARTEGARDVAAAEQSLARTVEQAARQQADAAERVIDAQGDVARALADTGTAAAAAGIKADLAMADLAPNAQELVRVLRALRPAWDDVRLDVQQRYLAGIAGEVQDLAGRYLPILKTGLGGIADSFNRGVKSYAEWARQSDTLADTETIFRNLTAAAVELEPAGTNVAAALTDIGVVGSQILPELADQFTASTGRAREFVEEARRTGQLEAWMRRGVEQVGLLTSTLGNLGGISVSVFNAADDAGLGFLETLERGTGAVDDFFNSARGENTLRALFTEARAGVDALTPGIALLADGTADMTAEFANTGGIESSGRALTNIAEVIAPLLPMLGELAGETMDNLADGASVAARLLTPVVDGTRSLLEFLGPVAPAAAAMGVAFLVLGPVNAAITAMGVRLAALAAQAGLSATASAGIATAFSRVGSAIPIAGAALIGVGLLYEEFGSKADTAAGKVIDGSISMQQAIDAEVEQLARGTWHWDKDAQAKELNALATANVVAELDRQYAALSPMEQLQADVAMAQGRLNDEVMRFGADSPQAAAAADSLRAAQERLRVAEDDVTRATETHTDAMKRQADEAYAAQDAQFAYERALFQLEDAQQRVAESKARGAAGARDLARAELDVREAQVAVTRSAGVLAGAQDVLDGSSDGVTRSLQAQKDEAFRLAQTQVGPGRDAALRLAASLADSGSSADRARLQALGLKLEVQRIPGRRDTYIAVAADTGYMYQVGQYLDNVARPRTVYLTGVYRGVDIRASTPGRLASGGVVRLAEGGVTRMADSGILPGHTPGRDVHDFVSPTGGRLLLSGGEAVMRPEWTRAVGENFINTANAAARSGGVEGVRRLMGEQRPGPARAGRVSASRGFMAAPAPQRSPDIAGPIVASLAALRADLRTLRREVSIVQNYYGLAGADLPAKLAQVERTNAELGVFGA